jgi:AcrR family transcriptional regulator
MAGHVPAYQRLDVDERRRRLLELGADLFTRHSYAELSMSAIAREAGISKALLYHYFPSKQAYFVATLQQQAEELSRLIAVDASLPPAEQLMRALDAFLGWVEAHAEGYGKLLEGATTHAEVRELVDAVRERTADQILAGLASANDGVSGDGRAGDGLAGDDPARDDTADDDTARDDTAGDDSARDGLAGDRLSGATDGLAAAGPTPALRTAVHGWLWFMDGALMDWLKHRDLDRDQLLGLLLGTFVGAVTASGEPDMIERLTGSA